MVCLEQLKKSGAPDKDISIFEQNYGKKKDLTSILRDNLFDKDFYFLLNKLYSFNEDQQKLYENVLENDDSLYTIYSSKVKNSQYVFNSFKIYKSYFVRDSSFIKESEEIYDSSEVIGSDHIYNSQYIDNSYKIYRSNNIDKSSNIIESQFIINSNNIFNCKDIFNSSEILNTSGATNSFFCSQCNNITNCIFCFNLNDVEYHVFNKQVSKERFEQIKKMYDRLKGATLNFCKWPSDKKMSDGRAPEVYGNWSTYFENWSDNFWNWVISLPFYDNKIMLCITGISKFIYK